MIYFDLVIIGGDIVGVHCDLISVVGAVGADSTAELVRQELADQGIGDGLSSDPSRPTTFKKRYVVENQKLFRVSRLEEHNLDAAVEEQVIAQLERLWLLAPMESLCPILSTGWSHPAS